MDTIPVDSALGSLLQTLPLNVIAGLVLSHFLDWLKKTPYFPWIQQVGQPRLKAAISGFITLMGALGIAYSFDPVVGSLTITGLTMDSIGRGFANWVTTWAVSQTYYKGVTERQKAANRPAIIPGTGLSEAEVREHARATVAELLGRVASELRTDARTSVERGAA